MRVISGKLKGRRLKAPSGLKTRPTTDKIKESLYNVIASLINDSNVLDLFAGSGGLGIEALSRGAKYCVFVDNNYQSIKNVKENIYNTHLQDVSKVIKCDWKDYFKKYYDDKIKYDIILLDPPYSKNMVNAILEKISEINILSDSGIIVVETDVNDAIPEKVDDLKIYFNRKYGRTVITIYSRSGNYK